MTGSGENLTLTRVQAISYRIGAGHKRSAPTNFLIELEGTAADGRRVVGQGEGQPRDESTGDREAPSWEVLEVAVRSLANRQLQVPSVPHVAAAVRDVMRTLTPMLDRHAAHAGRVAPFRGTMLGLETALLDLMSRALDVPLATVLGSRRDKVHAHGAPISAQVSRATRAELLREHAAQYPATRMYGRPDVAENLQLLEAAAAAAKEAGAADQPLWIDLEGRLEFAEADALVADIVAAIGAGTLPSKVIIGNAVPLDRADGVIRLQRRAVRRCERSGRPGANVVVTGGQSVWEPTTLGRRARWRLRLAALGGRRIPKAVHLRPAEVGGVVATVEMADAINRAHPNTAIYLGANAGSTEIMNGLLRNMSMAMPDVVALADEAMDGEPVVVAPTGAGVDAGAEYERILGDVKELVAVPEPIGPSHGDLAMNEYPDVDVIRPLGLNFTKGFLVEREALARGLSTKRFTRSAFLATDGIHEALTFKRSRTPLSSAVAMALCTHKEATRLRLQRAGVPVPKGATFSQGDYGAAREFAERIGYPVVVKPAMGVSGVGVAANIQDDDALHQAFDRLETTRFGSGDFIVEQHIRGRDHRIVVVGDQVVGAILRDPASVDGDGSRTVAELIVAKNAARRANPHLWGRPIKYDDAMRDQLARSGMTLDSVPARGQRVVLSSSGNLALGADSVDVLDDLHPSIKQACIEAVQAVPGMAYCGIDFLLEDHTTHLAEQQAAICELNAHAAIGNCEYPIYGVPREVARRIIDECITQYGLAANADRAERIALKLTIRGKVTGVGFRAWMVRRATETGVSGWVRNVDERTAEAVVIGELQPAAALAAAAIHGPRSAAPTEVITSHLDPEPVIEGFEMVKHAPQGATVVG